MAVVEATQAARQYVCSGCGAPYELNAYKVCGCVTNCAFNPADPNDKTVAKPRCAWCNAVPTAHNLDGEDLCLACCNKWARGEGLAALDLLQQAREYVTDALEAMEHSDGRDLLNEIDAALVPSKIP